MSAMIKTAIISHTNAEKGEIKGELITEQIKDKTVKEAKEEVKVEAKKKIKVELRKKVTK